MTRGKIVLVPFPFDDLSGTKVRPAVCLSDPFISSRIQTDCLETDLVLDSSRENFEQTGLKSSSTLRLHRLMTAATSLIRRELGQLSPDLQAEVAERLRKLFGLA